MTWQFSLAGLLVGVLVGLTGMDVLGLGLAGIVALGGLKLLEVPESKWVLGIGLGVVLGGLAAYGTDAWLSRPRAAAARTFD